MINRLRVKILDATPLLPLPVFYLATTILNQGFPDGNTSGHRIFFLLVSSFLAFILSLYCLCEILCRKNSNISFSKFELVVFLLLLFTLCVFINSGWKYNEGFAIQMFILFWLLVYSKVLISDRRRTLTFLWLKRTVFIIGVYECIIGLIQLNKYYFEPNLNLMLNGSFHNSGIFAIFLATVWPLYLKSTFKTRIIFSVGHLPRLISNIFLITSLVLIILTQSRTALLAIFLITILYFFYKYKKDVIVFFRYITNNTGKKVIVFVIIGLILWFSAYFLYSIRPASVLGRVFIWKISSNAVNQSPIMGYGIGSFERTYNLFQLNYFSKNAFSPAEVILADKIDNAFNYFIQIAVEQGILMMLSFIIIVIAVLRKNLNFQQKFNQHRDLLLSFLTLILCSFSSYPLVVPFFQVHFLFLIVLLNSNNFNIFKKIYLPAYAQAFVFIFLSVFFYFLLGKQIKIFQAKQDWEEASSIVKFSDRYCKALPLMQNSFLQLNYDGSFLLDYGKLLSLLGRTGESDSVLRLASKVTADPVMYISLAENAIASDKRELAKGYLDSAIWMVPNRFYPRYLKVLNLLSKGDSIAAIEGANEILMLDVKVPSPIVSTIKNEMKRLVAMKVRSSHLK